MKNILTIDTANTCTCVLVSAYDTKTNEIIIEINLGSVLSPRLDISGTTAMTRTLKANANNQITIASNMWPLGGSLQFRYADSIKTGDWFTINFPQTVNDIYIKKNDATTFAVISKPVTPDYQAEIDALKLSKVNVIDIVNNLTSTATDKPLAANQGKVLNDNINKLYNNLLGAGGAYFSDWSYKTTKIEANKNTVISSFKCLKTGMYLFIPAFRTTVPAGHIFSVGLFGYSPLRYEVNVYEESVTMVGTGKKSVMNGIQVVLLTAGTTYYIHGRCTSAITLDSNNWYHVYCLKET